jgi:hypothetical protein
LFASKYLQLFVAFGISGMVHSGATMMFSHSFNDDGAFLYFIGQAGIIMVEDHVVDLGKQLGFADSLFWRLVGCMWTVLAIGATTQVWLSAQMKHGMWAHDRAHDFFGVGPKMVA